METPRGGVAAALVLLPVPAMAALTFTGTTWTVASDTQSGGPTPPAATFTDVTNNPKQEDDLYVNMGNYTGSTKTATSSIELTRGITLSSSNQLLEFEQNFMTELKQAGLSVTVSVKNSSGQVVQTPLTYSTSTSSTSFVKYTVSQANINNLLKSGAYTLDVTVAFYIVGGPIYQTHGSQFSEAELRALAVRCGVEGSVGFVGFQEAPAEAFRALNVVVHASTRPEPFGLTIVEAMACGKAVAAVAAGGAAELIQDGRDALALPPGDADALAAAIGHLVNDPALRARLGDEARRTVLARFTRDGLSARFLCLYRQARQGSLASDP